MKSGRLRGMGGVMVLGSLVLGSLLLAPREAAAARAGQKIPGRRVDDREIRVDGRLDDPGWKGVRRLPRFIQSQPSYGEEPTLDTEVYVVYGTRGMYFGFVCHQPPDTVRGSVARKDDLPPSDRVAVDLDPNHDHTNGFHFTINPSGAQADAQISQDEQYEFLWDGVWEARTARDERGWTAEIFIPWSTLRFDARPEYTFGLNVGRWVNDIAEETQLAPPPQGLRGRLSWAADYTGVTGIKPGLNLELRPFVSMRIGARRPTGTLDHSWRALPNAGYSAKYGLRGNLTLDVAVNPDFGQAEVDPAVLNLGPFEVFFQERRQFFLESKQVFETPLLLFYTRRVGNNPTPGKAQTTTRTIDGVPEEGELVQLDPSTRILDSVRVTGEVAEGWQLGAMTATTGPTYGVERFSDGSRQRVEVDPVTQYSVARVRRQFDSQTYVGGIVTSVIRPGDGREATAGGLDYDLRFRRRWRHAAQVVGTHDGEHAGMGVNTGLSRFSKNTAFGVNYEMLTPRVNFNDLGFMQFGNTVGGNVAAEVFNAQPLGRDKQVRGLGAGLDAKLRSSFAGQILEKQATMNGNITSRSLWNVHTFLGGHLPQLDIFETRGGIAYEVPGHWWTGGGLSSPFNRKVSFGLSGNFGRQSSNLADHGPTPGTGWNLNVSLRPVDRLQIGLEGGFDSGFWRPRWVARADTGEPVFARALLLSTNYGLRMTLGITPRLTIQSYNQLLYSTAHHDGFYLLTSPDTLEATDPTPYTGLVDQSLTALVSNSILRWEYWPGSFFFVAYTHRSVLDGSGMSVRFAPDSAFTGIGARGARHEDIVFLKLVHLFAL